MTKSRGLRKTDPKYMGIPNICFSLTDKNDKRENKYRKQRLTQGFDNSELWSLDSTISRFIYPRIMEFRKSTVGYPMGLTEKKWDNILSKIERTFEILSNNNTEFLSKEEEENEIKIGFKLFIKWYFCLWY